MEEEKQTEIGQNTGMKMLKIQQGLCLCPKEKRHPGLMRIYLHRMS